MTAADTIDPNIPPTGPGCVECSATGGWWMHLRRCAACGHVGCCDSSPSQHATAHFSDTGHEVMQSFEPGEDWGWNFRTQLMQAAVALAPPTHHPLDQPAPGPADRVPRNWESLLR